MTTLPLINRSSLLSETEKSRNSAAYSKAFTLIELLTVIVIVLILMALLLPALGRAKYTAKNVICINNQKQMVIGATNYATDNDMWYPGDTGRVDVSGEKTDSDGQNYKNVFFRRSPPHMLVNKQVNYPELLNPYVGTLKANYVCPLAPQPYQIGGVVAYGKKPRDIDTQEGLGSYSHFYGRLGKHRAQRYLDRALAAIKSSYTSGYIKPTLYGDSYWGSGDVYFQPALKRGMMKVGDVQKIDIKNPIVDEAEYSIMTSDVAWAWNNMYRWTHEAYGQKTTPASGFTCQYEEFYWNTGSEALGTHLAINYSTADGAVFSIPNIKYLDSRVAATRYGGNNGKLWAYRAWLLPQPEN